MVTSSRTSNLKVDAWQEMRNRVRKGPERHQRLITEPEGVRAEHRARADRVLSADGWRAPMIKMIQTNRMYLLMTYQLSGDRDSP
mmetsp:Transcript_28798/g.46372  ORF Transcript_28798/g.46372 Transcript_28798/m.46372 type:complete len:85 (+) Transcript_28798:815-1069(+)